MSLERLSRIAGLETDPSVTEALRRERERRGEEASMKVLICGALISSTALTEMRERRCTALKVYLDTLIKKGPLYREDLEHFDLRTWASYRGRWYRGVTRECGLLADIITLFPRRAKRFIRTKVTLDHWLSGRLYAIEAIEHALRHGMDIKHWLLWMKAIGAADGRPGFWSMQGPSLKKTLEKKIETMFRQNTYYADRTGFNRTPCLAALMTEINLPLDIIALTIDGENKNKLAIDTMYEALKAERSPRRTLPLVGVGRESTPWHG